MQNTSILILFFILCFQYFKFRITNFCRNSFLYLTFSNFCEDGSDFCYLSLKQKMMRENLTWKKNNKSKISMLQMSRYKTKFGSICQGKTATEKLTSRDCFINFRCYVE